MLHLQEGLLSRELWPGLPQELRGDCFGSVSSHQPSHNLELRGLGLERKRGKEEVFPRRRSIQQPLLFSVSDQALSGPACFGDSHPL